MIQIENALLHAQRAEVPEDFIKALKDYIAFVKENGDLSLMLNERYALLFGSGEPLFPITRVCELPLHAASEERYPGFFNTVIFLLAAEHFERFVNESGFSSTAEMTDTYYKNVRRFMEMNKVRDNTYALVRHGHYLYGYAKPFILRIGRLAYQLMQFDGSLFCPFMLDGAVRFALNPTATATAYGYPEAAGDACEWNEGRLFGEDGVLLDETVKINDSDMLLKKGDYYITLHIPSDGKLSPELVKSSLSDAAPIVKKVFREYSPRLFACGSWLLSPQIKDIVAPGSNIARFRECFDSAPGLPDTNAVFEHIFKSPVMPISELKASNAFQEGILHLYRSGAALHMGMGILKKELVQL